jgi:lysophospholipid acyltransferase (LPLAT)-like uncharacterized protein
MNPILLNIFGWLGAKLAIGLCWTYREEIFGKELFYKLYSKNKSLLVPCWHRGIINCGYHFKGLKAGTLGSMSKDAEIPAAIVESLGFKVFKGSSTRGGQEALNAIIDYINSGNSGGLTADGPVGPQYVSKPGMIKIAARTGAPILCFAWDAEPSWEFNTWDKLVLPKPLARVCTLFDRDPMHIPPGLSLDDYEILRQELDRRMNILSYQARFYVKNHLKGIDPRDIDVPENFMDYLPKGKPRVRKNRTGEGPALSSNEGG